MLKNVCNNAVHKIYWEKTQTYLLIKNYALIKICRLIASVSNWVADSHPDESFFSISIYQLYFYCCTNDILFLMGSEITIFIPI